MAFEFQLRPSFSEKSILEISVLLFLLVTSTPLLRAESLRVTTTTDARELLQTRFHPSSKHLANPSSLTVTVTPLPTPADVSPRHNSSPSSSLSPSPLNSLSPSIDVLLSSGIKPGTEMPLFALSHSPMTISPISSLSMITSPSAEPLPSATPSAEPLPSATPSAELFPATPLDLPPSAELFPATPSALPSDTPSGAGAPPSLSVTDSLFTGTSIPVLATPTIIPITLSQGTTNSNKKGSTDNPIAAAAIIGIAVGATITIIALTITTSLLICFCCCCMHTKKYVYSTGNENRMTVQQWNVTSAHFNMKHADSNSSIASSRSRGSSIFGSTRRYSNSADHVSSIVNQSIPDLYSTPL